MSDAGAQYFSIAAGDSALIPVTVETSVSGDTLEGATIRWQAYNQAFGVASGAPIIVKTNDSGGSGLEVIPSPPMTFTIQLDEADTLGLSGNYYHEASVVDEIGGRVTILKGIMTVTQALNAD